MFFYSNPNPADYQNIFTLDTPFTVDSSIHTTTVQLTGVAGDRFRFFCPFPPTDSDLLTFYCLFNGATVISFSSIVIVPFNGVGFYFEITILDSDVISFYAVIDRNQTAPEIQVGTYSLGSSTFDMTCEIKFKTDTIPIGTISTMSVDKIINQA